MTLTLLKDGFEVHGNVVAVDVLTQAGHTAFKLTFPPACDVNVYPDGHMVSVRLPGKVARYITKSELAEWFQVGVKAPALYETKVALEQDKYLTVISQDSVAQVQMPIPYDLHKPKLRTLVVTIDGTQTDVHILMYVPK